MHLLLGIAIASSRVSSSVQLASSMALSENASAACAETSTEVSELVSEM